MKLVDKKVDNIEDVTTYTFCIPENHAKIRLDKFISEKLEILSRSQIKKLINDSNIKINNNPAKASHLTLPNEIIEVTIKKNPESDVAKENIPLNIVFEDEYLMVVNKPAGMVTHPAYGNMTGTLVNALLYYCEHLSTLNNNPERPGIVHRLDMDTSGLLVIAKNDQVHKHLAEQFKERSIEREYRTFAWGSFSDKNGRIVCNIGRSSRDRTKMVVVEDGKKAITNYSVIEYFPLISFVAVKLETGRTHQIRVHFKMKGHSVVGDAVYGGRKKQIIALNHEERKVALQILKLMPRQALHAKKLGFLHPIKNEFLRFDSELPDDMQNLYEYIKGVSDRLHFN